MTSKKLVQSVSRTLSILDHLGQADDGLTLQQLSNLIELKPPTVHNLLQTLLSHGYVERASNPIRYRLGSGLADLVDQHRNRSVEQRITKIISELSGKLKGMRITYAEEVNGDVMLKLRMAPDRPGVLERPYRSIMISYSSATVLIFQAFWPAEQRTLFYQRYPFEKYASGTWQNQQELNQYLETVRINGFAEGPIDHTNLYRLAIPVFSPTYSLIGVLGSAIPCDQIADFESQKPFIIETMKTSARNIFAVDDKSTPTIIEAE